MGDFPMMTEWGTFIINGTERVIVTQLVRSPGAYLMEPKDRDEAGLHREPDAEPRLVARARDRQEGHRLRPHRPQAQAADHDAARACRDPTTGSRRPNEAILALFDNSHFIRNTLENDTTDPRRKSALIEVFKKQRPGEPPTLDNARNLLRPLFFDPKRYDLTKVGRYKLNQRLGVDDRPRHPRADPRRHPRARPEARRAAASASACPRTRSRSRTSPPTRSSMPREPDRRPSSTSTSTSATAACAPSAS